VPTSRAAIGRIEHAAFTISGVNALPCPHAQRQRDVERLDGHGQRPAGVAPAQRDRPPPAGRQVEVVVRGLAARRPNLDALREARRPQPQDRPLPFGRILELGAEPDIELCRRLELKGRKKSHRMTVESDLRNHITPFSARGTLDRITPEDIERYIAAKQYTLAIKTIRNHVDTMHSVFELGLRKGWCQRNPVKLADHPAIRTTETRIKFLEQDEVEKLLSTSYPDDAFGRIEPTRYVTAAMTGLRQGELLGLRWRDVDLDARRVRVVSPFVRGEFGDPKSEGSGRSVPMAERVAVALQALRERSVYPRDRDLVFCHPETGKPLDRSKLVRRFKQALARADVREITFHELRHTFGTRMAAAGTPLRTLQHWMGHADSKTTQVHARYQPSPGEADAVDRAFA
jgi:integrase